MIMNSSIDDIYLSHEVFAKLNMYIDFYESLAFRLLGWVSIGIEDSINIDTYVLSSIQGTVESIKYLLEKGRINDANALMRKYHDSTIIHVYTDLYLEDNFSIDNLIVRKIDEWVSSKKPLPRFPEMIDYIEDSDKVKGIVPVLKVGDTYNQIRNRSNDHMHYNFFAYMLINDNEIHIDRIPALDQISRDIEQIFIQHFTYLFSANDHYMSSSDYTDALEAGQQPEEGSQYFVAPFIQEMFDSVIKLKRPDVAAAIKENSSMQLES
jgi:hypothetical protein